jgi:hypothetical protein
MGDPPLPNLVLDGQIMERQLLNKKPYICWFLVMHCRR